VTTAAEIALVAGATLGLWPVAALMVATSYATRDGRSVGLLRSLGRAASGLPSLAALLVVVGGAQLAAVALGAGAAYLIQDWASEDLGETLARTIAVAVACVFVAGALGLGIVHDLARTAVVRSRATALGALAFGAGALRRTPLSLGWSWAWRAMASWSPVVAVAGLATRLGGRGGWALLLLALLHQATVLSRVALRASWLAQALRRYLAASER
jgi:hypothetical protein